MVNFLLLLAQSAPTLPTTDWWSSFGPLGILGMIVAAMVVGYFWLAHLPHKIASQKQEREHVAARQALEIEEKKKQNALLDTFRENEGADQQYKQRQLAMLDTQTELIKRVVSIQENHAKECTVTRQGVEILLERSSG